MEGHGDTVHIVEQQGHFYVSPWPFGALLNGEQCNLPHKKYHSPQLPQAPSWQCTFGIAIALSILFGHCTWQHNNHLHKCLGTRGDSTENTAVGHARLSARLWLACSCRSTESGKSLHTWSHLESQEVYFLSPGNLGIWPVPSLLWLVQFGYRISVCNIFCTKKGFAGVPVRGGRGGQPQGWLPATASTQSAWPWKSRCDCARNWFDIWWLDLKTAGHSDSHLDLSKSTAGHCPTFDVITKLGLWTTCGRHGDGSHYTCKMAVIAKRVCHVAAICSYGLRQFTCPNCSNPWYEAETPDQWELSSSVSSNLTASSSARFYFAILERTSCAGNPAHSGTQWHRCSPQFLESNLVSSILWGRMREKKSCETSTTSSEYQWVNQSASRPVSQPII